MKKLISALAIAALMFTGTAFAKGSFGGSRGGSSFSSGRSSSFGGSRSGSTAPSAPSKGSSFGGSRSTSQPAQIVRKSSPSSGTTTSSNSPTTVNHYYGGGGYGGYGYGYGNGGFVSGFMWGQMFNRPQVVYVNGQQYVQGDNGQPMLDERGQPVVYESHPVATAFAALLWILIIIGLGYFFYYLYRRING